MRRWDDNIRINHRKEIDVSTRNWIDWDYW